MIKFNYALTQWFDGAHDNLAGGQGHPEPVEGRVTGFIQ
jgi:hypothetical protein